MAPTKNAEFSEIEETFVLHKNTSIPSSPDRTRELDDSIPHVRRQRNPPTIRIVLEAIEKLGDKKGSTFVIIKNWTMANYPEMNKPRIKFMLTKALQKGMKDGTIINAMGNVDQPLTSGRFKLAKSKAKPSAKKVTKVKTATKKTILADKTNQQDDEEASTSESDVVVKKKRPPVKKTTTKSKKNVPEQTESVSDTEVASAKPVKVAALARRRRSKSETEVASVQEVLEKPKRKNKATKTKKNTK